MSSLKSKREASSINQPNMILIVADDLGFSDIGCFGSEIQTPNLDRLGFEGVRFSQLYNSARCCPTRASILTGLSPHQAGIGHMVDDWGVGPSYQGWLREDTITIAEALKPSGYDTLYSGKWHVNWSFEPEPGAAPDSLHHHLGATGFPHPMQRGFDEVYALMTGATSLFNPQHLIRQNQWIDPDQPGYYITDAITDEAIGMIRQSVANNNPFFLHLSHIAPHWPLHALEEDIERYRETYRVGWDAIRKTRHHKLQELGIIKKHWKCSDRDEFAPPWDSLSRDKQQWEAQRMAVYAAMVDRMDQSIGRLMDCLKQLKVEDNTMVMFISDNGGCAEFLQEDGWCQWYDHPTWDGRPMRTGNIESIQPGPDDTFMSYDLPWANASNTPFRLFKHYVHEGGISTPVVVSWPSSMAPGTIVEQPCHVQDIMPTLLDLAGVELPLSREGDNVQQPEGESFRNAIQGLDWKRIEPICMEHEGNAAIRKGKWKAVCRFPDSWELYDMVNDRTEGNNLASIEKETLESLVEDYEVWADRVGVADWPPGPWPDWMSRDEFKNSASR